jgi:hypothetical protein
VKRIVSVSIGSSSRDKKVMMTFNGEDYAIERIGTDGDVKKAISIIRQLDGDVDVFGMGGIDLYLYGKNNKKYVLKSALPLAQAARKTPIVDGSGLKNTLERNVVKYLNDHCGITLKGKNVLLVCAMDRFGMAEAFCEMGCRMVFGDVMFALGLPFPIRKLANLHRVADILFPVVSRVPFENLYPTGNKQHKIIRKFEKYYNEADIIAGDFLYIKKHMPKDMNNKIIVTNTITEDDIAMLKERGIKALFTSTPEFDGRSFGTNVLEALLVSMSGKKPHELTPKTYQDLIIKFGITHRVEYFQ